ncbi:spermidine/putrescine ABC transporter substrate-binding protein [Eubacteriales bacterium OttesenSCG-928-N13]|nr:spermidine/putrescine ABC transporter substrate-binding protein [Eubacteriales bacterium OttesenSCG-928-N13]
MRRIAISLMLVLCLTLALPMFAQAADTSITVFNWYDYIDESVIKMFEEETGIQVKYANFTTNEEMYAKLNAGAGSYDVIFPSDYIIERMIREDGLEPLNFDNMPNARGVIDWMQKPSYDPTGEYSVAYMWGTVGILYNTEYVDGEITSWQTMFDPAYKKDVFMLDSIRDALGVTLKMLGYPINSKEPAHLEEAKQALLKQKADGIVKGYLVDETKDKMIAGEAAMALMWSGDALYSMAENDMLAYAVPEEGSNVWVDGMCIPKGARNKEAAEQFIDFLCRPDVARMNMDYIYYSTPIQAVVDEMSEEEKSNETLNPPQSTVDRCEFFNDISQDMEIYDRIWMEIRG